MTAPLPRRAVLAAAAGVAAAGLAAARPGSAAAAAAPLPLLLTFDDGPDPVWTARVLDILAWKQTRAVFLMTGEHAQMFPDLVRRVAAEGHHVGVHSWDHPHILTLDSAHQIGQVARTHDLLVSLAGPVVKWWRAPYGQSRAALDGLAHSLGLTGLGWHAEGSDWSAGIRPDQVEQLEEAGLAADPLVNRANTHPCPDGVAVVLLHDGHGENHTTAAADRWPGTTCLVSLIDRHQIADPATL